MQIKPIGSHLEAVCSGCGEVLLVGANEPVNFRMGGTENVCGVEVPMPEGLLCAVCNRRENGDARFSMRFASVVCPSCGGGIGDSGFEPQFDENGEINGFLCGGCQETWRTE